ncbi:MAG: DUF4349 domain-containing protein [Pseudomonadota bacterium]
MRMKIAVSFICMLAACDGSNGTETENREVIETFEVAEASIDMEDIETSSASAPQIAYSYDFSYKLPTTGLSGAVAAHRQLCAELAENCRLAAMNMDAGDGTYSRASLHLLVEAAIAARIAPRLDEIVASAGGDASGRSIEAEDLSKRISDTEARIKAKAALADRLLGLLETGGADVGDMVEAERAFASAQEELDAARSWLAAMKQRVAMSHVRIAYRSMERSEGSFARPVTDAVRDSGFVLGDSLAILLRILVAALPWAALLAVLIWLKRKTSWSLRQQFRRKAAPVDAD